MTTTQPTSRRGISDRARKRLHPNDEQIDAVLQRPEAGYGLSWKMLTELTGLKENTLRSYCRSGYMPDTRSPALPSRFEPTDELRAWLRGDLKIPQKWADTRARMRVSAPEVT
jgi:hypothetical protein